MTMSELRLAAVSGLPSVSGEAAHSIQPDGSAALGGCDEILFAVMEISMAMEAGSLLTGISVEPPKPAPLPKRMETVCETISNSQVLRRHGEISMATE